MIMMMLMALPWKLRSFFMGREMKHGGPQKRKLMLFKTGMARVEDRKMDEHTILSSGRAVDCKEKFLHYDFKDMTVRVHFSAL